MRILSATEKANRIELQVRNARLRLVQRLLIAAADADPELKCDSQWTRCLASATTLCVHYQKEIDANG